MAKQNNEKAGFDHKKFYTASAVVYAVLEDLEYGVEYFNKYLHYCFDGIRKLNFDVLHDIHVAEIEMKPWKQIDFPRDMVDWTKIGFRCGGTIKVFTSDGNIPKIFDKVDCVPQPHESCPDLIDLPVYDQIIPFLGNANYFSGGDHFYGLKASHNGVGYFDVDKRARVINFSRVVNNINTVYLEYITDGLNPTGQTVIHPYAYDALKAFIHWQRKRHDDRYSLGERKEAKELWEEELDDLLVRNLNLTIDDIKEILRSQYTQVPKG